MTHELIERDTVAQLVENYEIAVADLTKAYTLLHSAKSRLNESFGMGQHEVTLCCPISKRSHMSTI